jgi:hypothetical protein
MWLASKCYCRPTWNPVSGPYRTLLFLPVSTYWPPVAFLPYQPDVSLSSWSSFSMATGWLLLFSYFFLSSLLMVTGSSSYISANHKHHGLRTPSSPKHCCLHRQLKSTITSMKRTKCENMQEDFLPISCENILRDIGGFRGLDFLVTRNSFRNRGRDRRERGQK